jgi:hypothetical protein
VRARTALCGASACTSSAGCSARRRCRSRCRLAAERCRTDHRHRHARLEHYANIPGFPLVNHINGDALSHLTNLQFNSGYDLGGVHLHAFGSYSKRNASAYENLRVPDRIIASAVLGVGGTSGAPGSLVYDPDGNNPSNGFNPREGTVSPRFLR